MGFGGGNKARQGRIGGRTAGFSWPTARRWPSSFRPRIILRRGLPVLPHRLQLTQQQVELLLHVREPLAVPPGRRRRGGGRRRRRLLRGFRLLESLQRLAQLIL